jgi:hypothetical protein
MLARCSEARCALARVTNNTHNETTKAAKKTEDSNENMPITLFNPYYQID